MDTPMRASTVYDLRAGLAIIARCHRSQLNFQSQEKFSSISLSTTGLALYAKFDAAFFLQNFADKPL